MPTALILAPLLALAASTSEPLADRVVDRERILRDGNLSLTRRDFAAHVFSAEQLLAEASHRHGSDSLQAAQARAQLGIALHFANRPVPAVRELRTAITALERKQGLFHAELVEPLGYLGLSLQRLEQHEVAADALVRARSITHRQLGLLNQQQIPLVYSTADSVAAQGELWQAEQLQYAVYRLHEHNFGSGSPETVGALNRLALWLTDVQRFRPALTLYRRGLRSLTDNEGNDTADMVPLLEGMARAFLFQRMKPGRALNLLLRVAELTDAKPDQFGPADRFMARVQLGDALLLFSHERGALEHYQLAWKIASDDPELAPVSQQTFDQRALVTGPFIEFSDPPGAGDTWFHFAFDLRPDGRPEMVRLMETNARASVAGSSINLFRTVRFRPQFIDGEPVGRPDQEIVLAFRRGSRT